MAEILAFVEQALRAFRERARHRNRSRKGTRASVYVVQRSQA